MISAITRIHIVLTADRELARGPAILTRFPFRTTKQRTNNALYSCHAIGPQRGQSGAHPTTPCLDYRRRVSTSSRLAYAWNHRLCLARWT
ncbi:hypothetical protein GE21DRAFT_1288598 [Neurospora crassa]|nr:hypothetical protein GE21DRAFT_1288598 [Neurospora crassa]